MNVLVIIFRVKYSYFRCRTVG